MSAEATAAIVVSRVHSEQWGEERLRPLMTLYLIHWSTPVLATEAATLRDEWEGNSIIVRPDPAGAAKDIAYFVGTVLGGEAWPSADLADWPRDPRDDDDRGFEVRGRLDAVVASAPVWEQVHLTVVAFEEDPLVGEEAAAVWRGLGMRVGRCDSRLG